MTKKSDIKSEHLFVVQDILNKYLQKDVIIWVFGSRAKKNTKPYSDLDLALDMNGELIDPEIISKIANDFEESDLPYKVDVLDIVTVSDKFREIIEIDKIRLYFKIKKMTGACFLITLRKLLTVKKGKQKL